VIRTVLFLVACYTAVVGTLVLITIVVLISDAVAAPGLARDVVAALGGHLVTLGSSVWFRQCANRRSTRARVACHGSPQG
jgi:hypothetical protein